MSDYSVSILFVIAATFFSAGLVKGVTGMGLPTVAMGILGGVLSPLVAASLLIVPSLLTNVWQLMAGMNVMPILRRLWTMMAGLLFGTVATASMLTGEGAGWSTLALGATLTIYAIYTLQAKPYRVQPAHERWLSPLVGILTGLITGATGVFVIPAVPYLQSLGFEKDDLVQALGLSFTVSTIALAIGLVSHGAFQVGEAGLSALAVLPALLGMVAGQRLRKAFNPATFKRCFLVMLVLLGLEMMLRSVC
ncbi:sulfite exporter TauE/SafE family protein [Agrobacterium sp. CNPSo 3708]|uniref:sulfite exporter TauE/SafE family protein n=1 Tax=unclassified Agrobacterium TaxID=2632611 RepID=UPI0023639F36|nr:sulfite exporter TauE/SafE family protein [Agrobacterium sp. CNPSo 3708]MDD1501107.1 sulfite exporter TauE/SafE family protein [Agrobacterium sp. CNPSo 3708]